MAFQILWINWSLNLSGIANFWIKAEEMEYQKPFQRISQKEKKVRDPFLLRFLFYSWIFSLTSFYEIKILSCHTPFDNNFQEVFVVCVWCGMKLYYKQIWLGKACKRHSRAFVSFEFLLLFEIYESKNVNNRDFPAGPVLKNWLCNSGHASLILGRSIKISHAPRQVSLDTTTTEAGTVEPTHYKERPTWCNKDPVCHN